MFLAGPGGRTMSDTAAFLGLTLPSTSKLIDELVRHRLVTRHADPQDRRRAKLAITPAGRTTLRTLLGGASGEIARRLASLPAAELRVIHRALSTIAPLLAITPVTEVARAG
jgi:DNA-binding MarR family transcriptional regulator